MFCHQKSSIRLEIGLEFCWRKFMASPARVKTNYPGVFYRLAERKGKPGEERVYYIVFKHGSKVVEEKVGRQYADDMTEAKASRNWRWPGPCVTHG